MTNEDQAIMRLMEYTLEGQNERCAITGEVIGLKDAVMIEGAAQRDGDRIVVSIESIPECFKPAAGVDVWYGADYFDTEPEELLYVEWLFDQWDEPTDLATEE